MRFRRSAISVSRAVKTRSSSATALARAKSAAACASDWAFDCSATAMARCCSASSMAWRRAISSCCTSRSLSDPLLLDRPLRGDAGAVHRLPGADLGALGLLLLVRPLARHVGPLGGALHLELALLGQARVLQLAVDVEGLALGLEVLVPDLDHGVLLDVVADLLAALDLLGEPREALGVEGVRRD